MNKIALFVLGCALVVAVLLFVAKRRRYLSWRRSMQGVAESVAMDSVNEVVAEAKKQGREYTKAEQAALFLKFQKRHREAADAFIHVFPRRSDFQRSIKERENWRS
jgi:thioredoxin-like negative regulator of GroEL